MPDRIGIAVSISTAHSCMHTAAQKEEDANKLAQCQNMQLFICACFTQLCNAIGEYLANAVHKLDGKVDGRLLLTVSAVSSWGLFSAIPFSVFCSSTAPEGSGAFVGASRRCWATASGVCSSAGTWSSAETDLRYVTATCKNVNTHTCSGRPRRTLTPKHALTVRGCPS